jgi:hypothetical protein
MQLNGFGIRIGWETAISIEYTETFKKGNCNSNAFVSKLMTESIFEPGDRMMGGDTASPPRDSNLAEAVP